MGYKYKWKCSNVTLGTLSFFQLHDSQIDDYTVNTAYSAIGYSAKSDIVPILGWYGIPYTNNYRI